MDDVEQVQIPSFSAEPTLLACNTNDGSYLQVTRSSIRTIRAKHFSEVRRSLWETSSPILLASCSNDLVVAVLASKEIVGLRILNEDLRKVFSLPCTEDVSCLKSFIVNGKTILAYGSWDMTVRMVEIPSLNPVLFSPLVLDAVPRTIEFGVFCSVENIFIAYGTDDVNHVVLA
jgi:hypothetical protein